jgi:response regulator of citrate/malate metabolism
MTSFTAYMCKTAFDYDARASADDLAKHIYSSEAACRKHERCTAECGIVAVRISLERIVQVEDYSGVI